MNPDNPPLRIAVVGPCASGKSSLVSALRAAGYEARHVAQEHSYVPNMWERISQPDVLIYLDVDHARIRNRRPHLDLRQKDLAEQNRRLAHAREHCALYLDTNVMSLAEVKEKTMAFLAEL